ncbi:MAG: cell envelope integrity protein TolA [Clostridia bacterium]|nr:cell envelope integrity protein TolA [Clostridia bacterium]
MSDRYSRMMLLPENQAAAGVPVVLQRAALLRDNRTGGIVAQLKLKNIVPKALTGISLSIDAFDENGNPLEGVPVFEYRRIAVQRDGSFGSQTPIPLPNAETRSIKVSIQKVFFSDANEWVAETRVPLAPMPEPKALEDVIADEALLDEYKRMFSRPQVSQAHLAPAQGNGAWICTCGALNSIEEVNCHICGCAFEDQLAALDPAVLAEKRTQRLETEAQDLQRQQQKKQELEKKARLQKEQKRAARAELLQKVKKKALIFGPIAVVLIAGVLVYSLVIVPNSTLKSATSYLEQGQYDEAIETLEKMADKEKAAAIIRDAYYGKAADGIRQGDYKAADRFINNADRAWRAATADQISENESDYPFDVSASQRKTLLNEYLANKESVKLPEYPQAVCKAAYDRAKNRLADYEYQEGLYLLMLANGYGDSQALFQAHQMGMLDVYDMINLGSIEQDGSNQPLSWIVIERSQNKAVLMLDRPLEARAFDELPASTWADSDLRAYLNGTFYEQAFDDEKIIILPNGEDRITLLTNAQAKAHENVLKSMGGKAAYILSYELGAVGGHTDSSYMWLFDPAAESPFVVMVYRASSYSSRYTVSYPTAPVSANEPHYYVPVITINVGAVDPGAVQIGQ